MTTGTGIVGTRQQPVFAITGRLVLLLAVLTASCGVSSGGEERDGGTGTDGLISDIRTEAFPGLSTVITVRWTTSVPCVGRVSFGKGGELDHVTPQEPEPVLEHEVLLLGLAANTEHRFLIEVELEGQRYASEVQNLKVLRADISLPPLRQSGVGQDGYVVVPLLGAASAVTIIDPEGAYVWYHVDDRGYDIFRARLSRDKKSVLYNAAKLAGDLAETTEIVRVSLDGRERTAIPVPHLSHDFVEHPDGTLAAIAAELREHEGVPLRGDRIVEIAPDGTATTVWSAWDCFDPDVHRGDGEESGWTLANALDYDETEDVYYLGMRNFSSIAKIDPATRSCEWVIGTVGATLTFAQDAYPFYHQHQFQVLEETILVMDNDGSPDGGSRVVEYGLDQATGTAREVWSYRTASGVSTFVLGEPTRLEDGDTFVNWSAASLLERVSPSGASEWRVEAPLGYVFGFHVLTESLYHSDR